MKKPSSWLFYWHFVGDVGSAAALGCEGGVGVGWLMTSAKDEPKLPPRAHSPASGFLLS